MTTTVNHKLLGLASAACTVLSATSATAGMESAPVAPTPMPMAMTGSNFDLSVALNADSFFGFYPSFAGAYGLSETMDFTFYGIFWSAGNFGDNDATPPGNAQTNTDWNEFGVGLNFDLTPNLSINPQIGLTSGNLLYNFTNGPAELNDGWVPNITINYDSAKWEGQIYSGLYLPLRDASPGSVDAEFFHSWINFGYKFNDLFSFGAHVEHLSGGRSATSNELFTWIGPYIQFRDEEKGLFARLTGGWAEEGDDSDTFYKMSAGYSF